MMTSVIVVDEADVDGRGMPLRDTNENVEGVCGIERAFHLALFDQQAAFASPGNYVLFAAAMGSPEWFWGTAVAMKRPATMSVIEDPALFGEP